MHDRYTKCAYLKCLFHSLNKILRMLSSSFLLTGILLSDEVFSVPNLSSLALYLTREEGRGSERGVWQRERESEREKEEERLEEREAFFWNWRSAKKIS